MRLMPSQSTAFALLLPGLLALPVRAQPQPDALQRAAPDRTSADSDGVQRIRIVGGSYFFRPARVVVKAHVPVELTLVKELGITPHSFVIHAPAAGIEVDTAIAEEPTRVSFTPTAPGRYEFYCSNRFLFLRSHRERGMEGVLEVVE